MLDVYTTYLDWGMGLCVVMAVIWLLRFKSKKWRAVMMAGAFLAFALLLYFVKQEASQLLIVGSGVLLFILLAADAGLRFADIGDKEEEEE